MLFRMPLLILHVPTSRYSQRMLTHILRQREAAGLRACPPLRATVLATEAALDAASSACIASSVSGASSLSSTTSDAASSIVVAEQRLQAAQTILQKATGLQSRARIHAGKALDAARRIASQVEPACVCHHHTNNRILDFAPPPPPAPPSPRRW